MDAERLTQLLDATWPAASVEVRNGWRRRQDTRGGNRVSATTALLPGTGIEPLDAPLYMIRPGEDALDARLAVRGYTRQDPTLVMEADPGAISKPLPRDRVIYADRPVARVRSLWATGGIDAGRIDIMERADVPKAVLLGRRKDRLKGAGFVACSHGIAMLHALYVAQTARRGGLARDLTHAFANWAIRANAAKLALLVTEANGPAKALYKGLGFQIVARYHYRKAPGDIT